MYHACALHQLPSVSDGLKNAFNTFNTFKPPLFEEFRAGVVRYGQRVSVPWTAARRHICAQPFWQVHVFIPFLSLAYKPVSHSATRFEPYSPLPHGCLSTSRLPARWPPQDQSPLLPLLAVPINY
ncbi:hypothetical protein HRR83_007953 [Exophiala dermatitidis]|uniref:Uncharacterized protein n=2 Tax=Exophiala dermatitidis TaxID=5970 RepID=H6BUP9_EXODN|nr:uncharacterized protein HMPREF1120_03860 [Exophiala dermatitidis NIH/UT8656]KAJ4508802.1 hypothetical protein HRR74_007393 [Exophiala dermatitidis]EHY55736.1 hypothetical protein HMPREF1120_03860 [Exophiala dermatitidis NIH/UT8656]KAJ4510054.1 hypothetical protein HRR73_006851 [Exophiala dermatitidis]KAJ4539056.1 hypothetical protein HRR77_006472 [Exophiala dermatitidis]KAJ4540663.1 hypothetical protein HRR76_004051 [Exophiala dermatitidis]